MAAEFCDGVLVFRDLPEDERVRGLGVATPPTSREVWAWSHVREHWIGRSHVGGREGVVVVVVVRVVRVWRRRRKMRRHQS